MVNIKKIKEILTASTFEVYEKMFFVFAEPRREDDRPVYPLQASIAFEGPFSGEMRLLLTSGLAETMAKNMLNLEETEVTDAIVADCVKESINMICGNFLRKIDPVQGAHMTIPTCGAGDGRRETFENGNAPQVTLAFSTDSGPFEIQVDWHQEL